jgi:hypothetical protein
MRSMREQDPGWPLDSALETRVAAAPETGRPSLRRLLDWITADRPTVTFLSALMLANALFALLHLLRFGLLWLGVEPDGVLTQDSLSLSMEWGYAEIFNYFQTLVLVGLLAAIAQRTRETLHLCWAAVFLLVAVDDALAIHQQFGSLLAAVVPLPPSLGLRAADLGEVTAWVGGALALVALLTFGFRGTAAVHREIGWYFAWLFGLLLFFGLGVDMLHSLMNGAFFGASLLLELIEDGGEMVSISLACALAFAVWRATDDPVSDPLPPAPTDLAKDGPVLDRIRRQGGL